MSVRVEVGIDCNDPEALAPFWAVALGYTVGPPSPDGTYLDLLPPEMGLPVVYFQRVSEPKTTKNRLHLDLWSLEPAATIEKLCALGATTVGQPRTSPSGNWWQVMRDPAGNEFCICRERHG